MPNLPYEIKEKIENIASKYTINDLKESAYKLSEKYLRERKNNCSFINSELTAISYAIIRMPATYGSLSTILEKVPQFIKNDINSVLDIGMGTGNSVIASKIYFSNPTITCIETNDYMINLAKQIIDDDSHVNIIKSNLLTEDINVKPDLIIASYMINELSSNEKEKLVNKLWNLTNKYLLLIEPGTPDCFTSMKLIRHNLIKQGAYVISPCPHNKTCPLCNNDWCHFVSRIERNRLHKIVKNVDLPYEDEKYCYLFLSKNNINTPDYRILRHPYINKGYIEINACIKNGTYENIKITKSNKELYKQIKKLNSGDSF